MFLYITYITVFKDISGFIDSFLMKKDVQVNKKDRLLCSAQFSSGLALHLLQEYLDRRSLLF